MWLVHIYVSIIYALRVNQGCFFQVIGYLLLPVGYDNATCDYVRGFSYWTLDIYSFKLFLSIHYFVVNRREMLPLQKKARRATMFKGN